MTYVLFHLSTPEKKTRTIKKIESFCYLPVGWNYGKGAPIELKTVKAAIEIYNFFLMLGLSRTDAFPGVDGEVMITAYHRQHYIGATIEKSPNGEFIYSLIHEINDEESVFIEGRTARQIREKLLKIVGEIWNTSGSFTLNTTIHNVVDSMRWRSKTLPAAGASPLLRTTVLDATAA